MDKNLILMHLGNFMYVKPDETFKNWIDTDCNSQIKGEMSHYFPFKFH